MYNSPKTSQWNDATVARLDALTKEGKSASQVAAIINAEFGTTFTRNAIIGKSHRVGLLCDGNTAMRAERKAAAQRRKAQAMGERSARSHTVRKVVRWGLGLKEIDTFTREAIATAHVPLNPKTIMQLDPGDCRWPCSGEGIDTTFCGGPTIDRDCSYCSRHVRLASSFSAWPRRKRTAGPAVSFTTKHASNSSSDQGGAARIMRDRQLI